MKLFQIEEPDGSPVDPDAPGAAIGIDIGGTQAEVAVAIGGNAVVLADREDFPLDLSVPAAAAPAASWQDLFEGARLRAERELAQPVTHAVIALAAPAEAAWVARLTEAAAAAGLTVLEIVSAKAIGGAASPSLEAAIRAEELVPRPEPPNGAAP